MPKPSLSDSSSTIQRIAGGNKGVHNVIKGVSQKVNVIAWVEFELIHVAIQYISRFTMGFLANSYEKKQLSPSNTNSLYKIIWFYVAIPI